MSDRSTVRTGIAVVAALGLGAGGLLFGVLLLSITAGVLIAGLGINIGGVESLALSLIFIQGVGCVGVSMAYIKLRPSIGPRVRELLGFDRDRTPFNIGYDVPDLRDVGVIVGGYFLAFSGVIVGSLIVSQLDVETGRNALADTAMANPEIILYLVPVMIFVVGPSEELLFRGVVQGRLREVFGPVPAILIASAAFAGMHGIALVGGSLAGNLLVLTLLLSPALVLGAAYEYTNNIVVPAIIHGIYNSTLVLLMYAAVVLGDEMPRAATLVVPT